MADRWLFSKIGLGYAVSNAEIQTTIRVTKLKRSSGDLTGDIQVVTNIEGVKTGENGLMHQARFNLSSSQTRNTLGKLLSARTPGKDMDWFDGLEMLCQRVMAAEAIGQPWEDVGNLPIEFVTRRYAIDPLAPARVTSLLYGPGGSGKSALALALAMSVRVGREIVPGLAPAIRGPVMYLDWETDKMTINERIQMISAGCDINPPTVRYRRCIRPLYEDAEDVANTVAEGGYVFLVIDSAGMAMGGVGDRGDVNESTLRLFDAIRHIGVSTLLIDHVSKQEMRTANGHALMPYGSVYKTNLARSAWEIRNIENTDDETHISLIHAKANDSKLCQPIDLAVEWTADAISFHAATFLPPATAEGGTRTAAVIAYLREVGWAYPVEIATATNIPSGTIRVLVSDRKRPDWKNFRKRASDGRYGLAEEIEDAPPPPALHALQP